MGVLTSTTNEVFRRIEMNEINGRTRRRTLDPLLYLYGYVRYSAS